MLQDKELIVFDLDGTLTESKASIKANMAKALRALLARKKVAVIGGGRYEQFQNQFLARLKCPPALLTNLFLFPTTSTSFYRYRGGWKNVYKRELAAQEKKKIMDAFKTAFQKTGYKHPKKVWGKVIEDRGTQVTFSALGQKAPVAAKEKWNQEQDVRPALMKMMQKLLPKFEVRRGGLTSIDVTKKGIDKAYGLRQIEKTLRIPIKRMVFIGDALYPGGNDYAAKRTRVKSMAVRGPKDTKKIIEKLIDN